MLNLNSIMVGTSNSKVLAEFYEQVFQKKPDMVEGDWYGFSVGSCFIAFGNHDKVKGKSQNPERMIFNLETKEVKEEFERIKKIKGVTVVAEPYSMGEGEKSAWIATFADPDNNYFQLMTPWEG